jgi:uncharacterized protein YndB with AHSA1/START domain
MMNSDRLQVTTPSEREIAMTRVFNAPRRLVFEAWTKPELLKRWLGVHAGWVMALCEIELRVGGSYRYLWRGPDGTEMGMRGTYREIVVPEKLVASESFDQSWYDGEAVNTLTLVEQAGKTTCTNRVIYGSKEIRDQVLKSPMEQGVAAGFDALAALLATLES